MRLADVGPVELAGKGLMDVGLVDVGLDEPAATAVLANNDRRAPA